MKFFAFGFILVYLLQNIEGGIVNRDPNDDPASLELFKNFMLKYNKVYSNETEFNKRFAVFRENLKNVKILQQAEQGTARYGVTRFSDLTPEEIKNFKGFRIPDVFPKTTIITDEEIPEEDIPENFDWREHNAVTEVKDQKVCGSCWAFSAVANIEGQWAIKKKELISLSEQEVLDCDKIDASCDGGFPVLAYEAVKILGGIESEKDYPYIGRNDCCHFKKSKVQAKVSGSVSLSTSEVAAARWLYKNGPLSAALNSVLMATYVGGISHPGRKECSPELIDHAVLIVGYGVDKSNRSNPIPYWLIKNSWGDTWGEQGYYRLYRGDNSCGINLYLTSATVN